MDLEGGIDVELTANESVPRDKALVGVNVAGSSPLHNLNPSAPITTLAQH